MSTYATVCPVAPAHRAAAQLDVTDAGFRVHSQAVHDAAEAHWYATTPLGPAVLRHEDVVALLRDRRLHQGASDHLAAQRVTGPLADMWSQLLLCVEGADHTRLRRLVSAAFTPAAVERLRPRMATIVDELVDRFCTAGECEFMADFADRYPPPVMFEMLGIPASEHGDFLRWGEAFAELFSFSVAERAAEIEAALRGTYAAVDRLAAARAAAPGEDLLSALVAARGVTEGGGADRLSAQELRSMVVMLVLAGQDTTRNQLGYAMVTFAAHPEQWALLGRHPELAARAAEEVMRANSVIPVIWRIAATDFTYKDLTVPAGTRLWLFTDTAQHETGVYGPAGFDITAERPAQLSFGAGIHYCLGAALARAEMTEALPVLARRLPNLTLAAPPRFRPELSGIMGATSVPIHFDPTAPR